MRMVLTDKDVMKLKIKIEKGIKESICKEIKDSDLIDLDIIDNSLYDIQTECMNKILEDFEDHCCISMFHRKIDKNTDLNLWLVPFNVDSKGISLNLTESILQEIDEQCSIKESENKAKIIIKKLQNAIEKVQDKVKKIKEDDES